MCVKVTCNMFVTFTLAASDLYISQQESSLKMWVVLHKRQRDVTCVQDVLQ